VRRKQTEETVLLATHELRQPLQSLSLALETLAPKARGKSAVAIHAGLTDIGRLAGQVKWLSEAFSESPGAGSGANISDLNQFARDLFSQDFKPGEINRVKMDLPHTPVSMSITEPLFAFLLKNLTENALKYSTSSVSISGEIGRKLVQIMISNASDLPASDFNKLGSLFFRSASPSVQNSTGFGLGLYLCGRVARRYGGKLQLTHQNGTTTALLALRHRRPGPAALARQG
jgi:signal transduction histidine kinase